MDWVNIHSQAILPINLWQQFRLLAMRTIYFGVGAIMLMLAVMKVVDGDWGYGLVLSGVGFGFLATWFIYKEELAPQWINFILVCALGTMVSVSIKSAGMAGVYWMYPVLAMVFFMFDRIIFLLAIMLIYALFAAAMYKFLPFDYAWRIGLSMLVLIGVGAVFLPMMSRMQRNILKISTSDPLTSFYKRDFTGELLQREIEKAREAQHPLSVMLLDIDSFKGVNDRFGYMFGDEILRETARRIESYVREQDILIRSNGAEFLVLFPNTSAPMAAELAQAILEQLRHEPYTVKSMLTRITASAGIAQWQPDQTWGELLEQADDAMYQAKSEGRDGLRIAQ
jgi:diguanylate cyclase (GGDEF)-like protein